MGSARARRRSTHGEPERRARVTRGGEARLGEEPGLAPRDGTYVSLSQVRGQVRPATRVGIIASAVKCANRASAVPVKPPAEPSLLQTFYVHLGSQHFAPGQELNGLEEIEFGEEIRRSALYDWAGMESISKDIEGARLRLRYQLAMSRSVLAGTRGM